MSTEQFLLIPSKSAVCKDGMESGVAEPGRHPGITKTAQSDQLTNIVHREVKPPNNVQMLDLLI